VSNQENSQENLLIDQSSGKTIVFQSTISISKFIAVCNSTFTEYGSNKNLSTKAWISKV
jgi:hypothetical protein